MKNIFRIILGAMFIGTFLAISESSADTFFWVMSMAWCPLLWIPAYPLGWFLDFLIKEATRKKAPLPKNPLKKISPKDNKNILIKNFIISAKKRGLSQKEIFAQLKKPGWSGNEAEKGLPEQTINLAWQVCSQNMSFESVALMNYVTSAKRKGCSNKHIEDNLIDKGWEKESIKLALNAKQRS